jgi:hypothetical protein
VPVCSAKCFSERQSQQQLVEEPGKRPQRHSNVLRFTPSIRPSPTRRPASAARGAARLTRRLRYGAPETHEVEYSGHRAVA